MKERVLQGMVRIESFADIDVNFEPNDAGIATTFLTQPAEMRYVGMSDHFAFSRSEILFTLGAATCSVIVVRKGETWGLYHDLVYPESKAPSTPSHLDLVKFLESARGMNCTAKLDFAFLFGANRSFPKVVTESRREAKRGLLEIAGFKENQIISRWNDVGNSSVNVVVNPASSKIHVERSLDNGS